MKSVHKRTHSGSSLAVVVPTLVLLAVPSVAVAQTASVLPSVETVPVPSSGDAADDMAVWIHPTDSSLSRVIGTDKDSGIVVYSLAGTQLQYLPHGELNNVDIRYDFPLTATSSVALVTSAERTQDQLAIYMIDPDTHLLQNVAVPGIALGFDVYGCCMYESQVTGDTYVFVTSEDGHIEQWRLVSTGTGLVNAVQVRAFDLSSVAEGCVADDEYGSFFLSQENVGIWRYGAEPGDTTAPVLIDTTGAGGHLTADVEGLAVYYAAGGAGHLLVSSQGSSTFNAYDRVAPHAHRLTFNIGANTALAIDAVGETDGIDVVNLALGSAFPNGAFLAQDGANPGFNQNFKFVPWSSIAQASNPPLLIDTTYDAFGAVEDTGPGRAYTVDTQAAHQLVPTPNWVDLGGGTTGINGPPTLTGTGTLKGGSPVTLHLTQAPPSAPMFIWVSGTSVPLDVFGGTIHANPFVAQFLFFADPVGNLELATTWTQGVPAGTEVWFQFLIEDLSVLPDVTLSNALLATTP